MRAASRIRARRRRSAAGAGVHPHLDGAVRRLELGPGAGAAAGDDPAARLVSAQRLRLRLLGAPDGGRAVGRAGASARCGRCRSRSTSSTGRSPGRRRGRLRRSAARWSRSTGCCRLYQRRPLAPLRRLALSRAERWIVDRQEADGGWGGIQPPWVYSLIALHLLGYPLDHPVIERGLDGHASVHDRRRSCAGVEACQSPVWDTCLALIALARRRRSRRRRGGRPRRRLAARRADPRPRRLGGAPARARARRLGVRVRQRQLPRHRRHRRGRAGAAHRRPSRPDRASRAAIDRGVRWLEGMQSSDGGWGAFDVDNSRALVRDLPFCDFGEVIDPPSADVTAHVVEMLGAARPRDRSRCPAAASAGCSTTRSPTARGSGAGASTTSTAPARSCRRWSPPASPGDRRAIRRAVSWLERTRTPTAAGARTAAPTTIRPGSAAARARLADRLGAAGAARRRRARFRGRARGGASGWSRTQRRTAAGTSRTTPARDSRRTSTSTTTSTG